MSDWTAFVPADPPSLLLFRLRRQKWLAVSCACALFAILAIVIQLLPPSYSASALVMVDSHAPRSAISGAGLGSVAPLQLPQDEVGTEMAVIHSHQLMSQVAAKLNLVDDYHFNRDLNPGILLRWQQDVGALLSRYLHFPQPADETATGRAWSDTVAALTRNVSVKSLPNSRVIEIRATAWNNKLAASIANVVADLYVSARLELAHTLNDDAQGYLTKRLSELLTASNAAAQKVEQYRAEHDLALGANSTLLQEQITELTKQLLDAQARLNAAQTHYATARNSNPEQLAAVLNSETMARLRELQATIETKRATLVTTYGPRSPMLEPFDNQLARVRTQIAAEARRWMDGLASQVQAETLNVERLTEHATAVRGQVREMELAQAHLDTLKASAAAAKNLYMSFLSRAKETDIDLLFPAADVRIVSPAPVPAHPAFPRNIFMLPGAAIISLGCGMMLGLLVESRRKGLVSSTEVEALLELPTLGMVPLRTPRSEGAYRDEIERLLNVIHFGLGARSMLVTSALPQEGKSMTARALADAAVGRGWRVLLVDADMRSVVRPQRTTAQTAGLAEVLRGELDMGDAMQHAPGSQLITMPAGSAQQNPLRLLSMSPAQNIIESLTPRFDLVIVDGPPVMAGGDCWMLSQHVDQTILVAAWDATPPVAIRAALKNLRPPGRQPDDRAPPKVAGVVLNKVNPQKIQNLDQADSIRFSRAMYRYHAAE